MAKRMDYSAYAAKNGWGLSKRQMIYWAKKHKEAKETGDTETVQWIEDLLTDINYHPECALFQEGKYEEAINRLYPNIKYEKNYGTPFIYKNIWFIPVGKLKKRNPSFRWDGAINIPGYKYEDFYEACHHSEADVFRVYGGSDTNFYIPATGGLGIINNIGDINIKYDGPWF